MLPRLASSAIVQPLSLSSVLSQFMKLLFIMLVYLKKLIFGGFFS